MPPPEVKIKLVLRTTIDELHAYCTKQINLLETPFDVAKARGKHQWAKIGRKTEIKQQHRTILTQRTELTLIAFYILIYLNTLTNQFCINS